MRRFVVALAGVAAMSVSANAADLPVKAPMAPIGGLYNWTGLYIGGNAGGAWLRDCFTYQSASNFGFDDGCENPSGFVGGGQIGFNWQTGSWVFGLEGSGDWASLKASHVSPTFGGDTINSKADSIFLATARLGYAWDRWLGYVKGGAAFVHSDYWRTFTGTNTIFATASETRVAWTAGVGLEYAFLPNWSAAVEYDYIGGGTRTITQTYFPGGCFGGAPCTEDIKQDVHMLTFRVNYLFNWMHP